MARSPIISLSLLTLSILALTGSGREFAYRAPLSLYDMVPYLKEAAEEYLASRADSTKKRRRLQVDVSDPSYQPDKDDDDDKSADSEKKKKDDKDQNKDQADDSTDADSTNEAPSGAADDDEIIVDPSTDMPSTDDWDK